MAIEYIDLIGLLKTFGTKGIEKSQIYGKITRQVERPSNLMDGVVLSETGIFVEMAVFAVNLKYYESYLRGNGVWNPEGIYMVNGNLVAYIEKSSMNLIQNDWYTVDGTIRFGSKMSSPTYVCVFNFYKTKGGKWGISPCKVSDLDISSWDRHLQTYSWMNESARVNDIRHPAYVTALPKFDSFMKATTPQPIQQQVPQQPVGNGRVAPVFNKESRTKLKEYNENVAKFEGKLGEAKTAKENYLKQLQNQYKHSEASDRYLSYMIKGIKSHLKHRSDPSMMTGRVIIRRYLDNFKGSSDKYAGTTVSNYLSDIFPEIAEYIVDHNVVVSASDKAWSVCKAAFSNEKLFYLGVVGVVLNLSWDTILDIESTCSKYNLNPIRILNENPYILQFISQLGFNEIERIALCFNRHNDKSLDEYRNISMLHAYISDTSDASTVFTKDRIMQGDVGVVLPKARYNAMVSYGSYLSSGQLHNIDAYLLDISRVKLGYADRFKQKGYNFIKVISAQELMRAIEQYNSSGLGVVVDNYVTSSALLEKELFVFNEMYKLGKITYNYDHELIDKYISEYEEQVGFKLEKMQRYGVHLLTTGGFIVAGGAGSGKTTVSNCIVYVLEKLEPTIDIQFAAPTGKAAKRMQEVVHSKVETLHSKFKLGIGGDLAFDDYSKNDTEYGKVAFFFDEGAMITIDLLYKVLKKLDTQSCRLMLFGDFDQLPPIGKGLPFKNLLRFMPCVFLNVSKRAVAGSKITANSNYINEYSDAGNWHQLESGDDFFLLSVKSDSIQKVVRDLCAYYLNKIGDKNISYIKDYLGLKEMPKVDGITEDDIQVVSPLAKPTYSWGSQKLNEVLEPLFNSTKTVQETFVYKLTNSLSGSAFSIGDRVIHVDKNMYSMQWYSEYEDGYFQKVYGFGICNGEVGKVVGFINSEQCTFEDEDGVAPLDFKYPDNLRDDSTWRSGSKWFVVVEYYDYISDQNFYILYRAEENPNVQDNRGFVLKGDDLAKLNLFYAGTTHKLQGSQNKIIICALDNVSYSGFITRQMIYTMLTRGEKLVFVVGSCSNDSTSMLSKARMDIASCDTATVGELFI